MYYPEQMVAEQLQMTIALPATTTNTALVDLEQLHWY